MPGRRAIIASLAASALSLPFARAVAAAAPTPGVRRYGAFYIVDGWVLTRSDLDALGVDAD